MKTNRNTTLVLLFTALIISALSSSCGGNANIVEYKGDTVAVKIVKQSDTTSFVKSNGEKCTFIADASIAVPVKYGNDEATIIALNKMFVHHMLEANDSLGIDDALDVFMSSMLQQYGFEDAPSAEDAEDVDPSEAVQTINKSINIKVFYNKFHILTLCRVDVFKKDDKVTSVTHRYYNFDLENKSFIGVNNLFRDDMQSALCKVLREKLMQNNKVNSEEQLNEIGFYNIDNMNVTSNFFFSDEGVTWSYLPNDLAVEALGEPQVTVSYDELEQFLCDNSAIKRINK